MPPELLLVICEYVASSHWPSLLPIALVSKNLYEACRHHIFRELKIRLYHPRLHPRQTDRAFQVLLRSDSLAQVKSLTIEGSLDFYLENDRDAEDDDGETPKDLDDDVTSPPRFFTNENYYGHDEVFDRTICQANED